MNIITEEVHTQKKKKKGGPTERYKLSRARKENGPHYKQNKTSSFCLSMATKDCFVMTHSDPF